MVYPEAHQTARVAGERIVAVLAGKLPPRAMGMVSQPATELFRHLALTTQNQELRTRFTLIARCSSLSTIFLAIQPNPIL